MGSLTEELYGGAPPASEAPRKGLYEELYGAPPPPPSQSDSFSGSPQSGMTRPEQPGGYNVIGLYQWFRNNPDQAAHIATQAALSTAGTVAGGVFGGPPGAAAGGAGGNYLGDVAGRFVGSLMPGGAPFEWPSLEETALDVGLGAAGPMTAATPRAGARVLAGANTSVRQNAREAGKAAFNKEWTDQVDRATRYTNMGLVNEEARLAGDAARRQGLRAGLGSGSDAVGNVFGYGAAGGTIYSLLAHGVEPALIVGATGAGLSYGRRQAAEYLIAQPWFQRFVLNERIPTWQHIVGAGGAGMAALQQNFDLTPRDRRALITLMGPDQPDRTLGGASVRRRPQAFEGAVDAALHKLAMGGRAANTPFVIDRATGRRLRKANEDDLSTLGGE